MSDMNRQKHSWRGVTAILFLLLAGLATACSRELPAIEPDLAAQKKAVLLLVSSSLSHAERSVIIETAEAIASEGKIALDIRSDTTAIPDDWQTAMTEGAADAVAAIGNDWMLPILDEAVRHPNIPFVLLQNSTKPAVSPRSLPANVRMVSVPETAAHEPLEQWVHAQQMAGQRLLWISSTLKPIPEWAGEEEVPDVLYVDLHPDDWADQLAYLIQTASPDRVVLYDPDSLTSDMLNVIQSLGIPAINPETEWNVTFNWSDIISGLMRDVAEGTLKTGSASYQQAEVVIH